MGKASIPVDLHNPGEVLASLGFLEAAEVLLGDAEGGFDWSGGSDVQFILGVSDDRNPFETVLEFIIESEIVQIAPTGFSKSPSGKLQKSECFPAKEAKVRSLPCRLTHGGVEIEIGHWADGSRREEFKHFAGQQSPANSIIPPILDAIKSLWREDRADLVARPFRGVRPIGRKSWNLDARSAWTVRDDGYSLNDQNHSVTASPVVELLGAVGLQHARPTLKLRDEVRYGVWGILVPPSLARPILGGAKVGIPTRFFRFQRNRHGRNGALKQFTFASEEGK